MRLYDNLMANPAALRQAQTDLTPLMREAVRYKIDNVAHYYWQNERDIFDLAEPVHFPSLAPPHPVTWIEYRYPKWMILENKRQETHHRSVALDGVAVVMLSHPRLSPLRVTSGFAPTAPGKHLRTIRQRFPK